MEMNLERSASGIRQLENTRIYRYLSQVITDHVLDYPHMGFVTIGNSMITSSNIWKNIGNVPYGICFSQISLNTLNGIIHWIGNTKIIDSFDIVEEKTKQIQMPSCYLNDES
ncbi:hypothetical protein C5167_031366 [Papaver somniferum]|uniref:Uncharacterized protein n=1 Tax=Papaver somniferum TaxID=3469 RepID=A0A4Y7K7Z0_PAPSO|nr:hypothetical protein C5167_031366 [Papaver somniferum]